ncbi:MAG: exo-alpha-sialidase [Cytophagaceae bacterium]
MKIKYLAINLLPLIQNSKFRIQNYIILFVLLTACSSPQDTSTIISQSSGQAPYLTKDHLGNTVLSWTEKDSSGDTWVYYATAEKESKNFGSALKVPASRGAAIHDESMNKLAFAANGNMIAVFEKKMPSDKNKYAGQILYSVSEDQGKNWTEPLPIHSDTTAEFSRSFFDLALLPDGEVGAVWLDGRLQLGKKGTTLFFTKTENGKRFIEDKPIGQTVCQCCRTSFLADEQGMLHVVYRNIISDTIRDMVHITSSDTGKTFTTPTRISADNWITDGCPHTGPSIARTAEGLHFTWFTAGGGTGVYYCRSEDNGRSFTNRLMLGHDARHPQMANAGETLAITWDEALQSHTGIFNRIALHIRYSGLESTTTYLTSDKDRAFYPVLSPHGNGFFVAYTREVDEKNHVEVQYVGF